MGLQYQQHDAYVWMEVGHFRRELTKIIIMKLIIEYIVGWMNEWINDIC